MNFQTDSLQAQRLKQILFPKKSKVLKQLYPSNKQSIKQNRQTNHDDYAPKYNIKQQIIKLKQGIQTFMQRQPESDNLLTTPRECLELIKCMSQRMINYNQEIQQAIYTLLQSIPKPLSRTFYQSKYFLMHLKISYFCSIFHIKKRVNLGESFSQIKKIFLQQKKLEEKQKESYTNMKNQQQIYLTNKMYMAFSRWRKNVSLMRKFEIQNYYQHNNIERSIKMMQLLPDQGRMVIYLQKIMQSNAQATQILLYNSKLGTLRSYKLDIQPLTSAFQSVRNQSQLSNLDDSFQLLRNKLKRLQINLQHSLTKICIIKRQSLRIQHLRKDPDYTRIDDYSSVYDLSARQLSGGCIFTPILTKNGCIGVIRQYFYSKVGQPPSTDTVGRIAQILQNCITTSQTFQQAKQKSISIRRKYYLKAVLILNYIEKIQQFTTQAQEHIYQLLRSYFSIKFIGQHTYEYELTNNMDKLAHFQIIGQKNKNKNVTNIVIALSKMHQSQTSYLYEANLLYIKLINKIFVFKVSEVCSQNQQISSFNHQHPNYNQNNSHQHQAQPQPHQRQTNSNSHQIPIQIITKILDKKQQIKQAKNREQQQIQRQRQMIEQQKQSKKMMEIKSEILDYCMQDICIDSQQKLLAVVNQYIAKFVPLTNQFKYLQYNMNKQEYTSQNIPMKLHQHIEADNIKIRLINKQTEKNRYLSSPIHYNQKNTHKIYQDESLLIYIQDITKRQLQIPQFIISPLIDLCCNKIEKAKNCIDLPNFDRAMLKSQIWYEDGGDLDASMRNLVKDWLSLSDDQIYFAKIKENPFVDECFCCYMQKNTIQPYFNNSSTQMSLDSNIIKQIRTNSLVSPNSINPISTVICLQSQLILVLNNSYRIPQETVAKLSQIYRNWKISKHRSIQQELTIKKNTNIIVGINKIERIILEQVYRHSYMKIKQFKYQIKYIPNFLYSYVQRQNMRMINSAFFIMKSAMHNHSVPILPHKQNATKQVNIKTLISKIYKNTSLKHSFNKLKSLKARDRKLHKLYTTLQYKLIDILHHSYNCLYLSKYIRSTNRVSNIERIINKKLRDGFTSVYRYSRAKQSNQIIQEQTQCSKISKFDNLDAIGKILKQKFSNYQVYLYIKSGRYISLIGNGCNFIKQGANSGTHKIQILEQLKDKANFQHFQFNCNGNTTKSKGIIKNVLWLVPESCTITLIQKHYLQVLSRAVQQGFNKFIYKNQQFLSIISGFMRQKSLKYLSKSLKNLRAYSMEKIKSEMYKWRDSYYESSIQVQNFKQMEKQQKREQLQRVEQVNQALLTKKKYEEQLGQYRKTMIRLEVSSRQFQEFQIRERLQNQTRQKCRLFNIWRVETAFYKKTTKRRQLARKKQTYILTNLAKLIKNKSIVVLKQSMKMVMIQSAHNRAKMMSTQKKALQPININNVMNMNMNVNMQIKQNNKNNQSNQSNHPNRLLTFQDQLNQFNPNQQYNSNYNYNYNYNQKQDAKQLSIIPISFKHFESSNMKENYDVTDEEARRLNGGAYKLNTKTLKFLKRMGKLNN